MKIALAQMEVIPGQVKKNLETMLRMISDAKRAKADLVAFPELCVSGYLLGDKWVEDEFCADLMDANKTIADASDGITVVYGNVYWEGRDAKHPNKDGRSRKFNAVYAVRDGKPVSRTSENGILPAGVQPKTLLPNYRIFDDERYFFSLEDVAKDADVPLETLLTPFKVQTTEGTVTTGLEICEDLWSDDYRKAGKPLNVSKKLVANGAKLLINVSASPWTAGKNSARDRHVKRNDAGAPLLYVNCTGAQNNGKNIVTFDGGSTAYNTQGEAVRFAKEAYREELILITDKELASAGATRTEAPTIEQKYKAIIRGIRHAKDMSGAAEQPRYVIGLSGGIDSTLVAALLAEAVGPEKVFGITMPSRYNSAKTQANAKHVADALGIGFASIPIESVVTANEKLLEEADLTGSGAHLTSLNKENIQAKVRGTSILSNIAAKYGAIFTNNGNKLEVALGYATLYGDVNGALAPIADLTKSEVIAMARYVNTQAGKEVIPTNLLPDELYRFDAGKIAPSAELKSDQVDPMKFGYHDALLAAYTDYQRVTPATVLDWYERGIIEEKLDLPRGIIERYGLEKPQTFIEDLEWFTSGIQRAVFKRVQAPPIIITSKSSYGYDIRESVLPWKPGATYERAKERVLAMDTYTRANEGTATRATEGGRV